MKAGRPVEVQRLSEWHLICIAMVHRAQMMSRTQRNRWMSAGDIQQRICSAVAMHHISGRQYRFGIRSMPHTIKTCMRCLEEMGSLFREFVIGADSFGQLSSGIPNRILSGHMYWLIVAIVMGILSQSELRLPLLQVVSSNKYFSVGVQSPTEINAPRGRTLSGRQWFCADRNGVQSAVILKRRCQLALTRITHQVSRAFDLNLI